MLQQRILTREQPEDVLANRELHDCETRRVRRQMNGVAQAIALVASRNPMPVYRQPLVVGRPSNTGAPR